MSNGAARRSPKREKTERDGVGSASSTSSGSFGMCSHKLYARSGVASAAASNGGMERGGGAELRRYMPWRTVCCSYRVGVQIIPTKSRSYICDACEISRRF